MPSYYPQATFLKLRTRENSARSETSDNQLIALSESPLAAALNLLPRGDIERDKEELLFRALVFNNMLPGQ